MRALATKIARYLGTQKGLSDDEQEFYRYGAEVLLINGSFIVISLFAGFLLHRMPETLLFLAAFFPIRSLAGGYHAPNSASCLVISLGFMLGSIGLAYLLNTAGVSLIVVLAVAIVFMVAPVVHPNSPHSDAYCVVLRRRARAVALGEASLALALYAYAPFYGAIFAATFGVAVVSTLVAAVQKRMGLAEYRSG